MQECDAMCGECRMRNSATERQARMGGRNAKNDYPDLNLCIDSGEAQRKKSQQKAAHNNELRPQRALCVQGRVSVAKKALQSFHNGWKCSRGNSLARSSINISVLHFLCMCVR